MSKHTSEPQSCPSCNSSEISYCGHMECGSIDVMCDSCGSRWAELWKFSGIVMIEGDDNREEVEA